MGDWLDKLYEDESHGAVASTPDTWGAGRPLDPFLAGGTTPEESPRKETDKETVTSAIDQESEPEEDVESEETKSLRERLTYVRQRTRDARGRFTEKTAPAREKIDRAREAVNPATIHAKRWSFVWAAGASWLIGPQFLIALYDHVVRILGQDQMMSGPQPMGWGILHGPGRWMRDVTADAWENDGMIRLVICAAFGIIPLLLIAASNTWKHHSKWLLGVAILGPAVYVVGVSYTNWTLTWQDIYLVGIFSAAWYCTIWAREQGPGFVRFLLLIPLASVVTGFLLYSPGAAF